MPKIIHYPRTNFKKTLELVIKLNPEQDSYTHEEIAMQSDEVLSGVLITTISSAVKYDLLEVRSGRFYKTVLFRSITNNLNAVNLVLKSFLSPEPYAVIYSRYNGERIDKETLERIFIKEYDCEPKFASRAVKYFIEGLQFLGLIDPTQNLKRLDLEHLELNELAPLSFPGEKTKPILKKPEVLLDQDPKDLQYAPKPKESEPPLFSELPQNPRPVPTELNQPLKSKKYKIQIEGENVSFSYTLNQQANLSLLNDFIKLLHKDCLT